MANLTVLKSARVPACLVIAACAGLAHADVIYQNTFDAGAAGSEWSHNKVDTLAGAWGSFLGNFGQETVRLTLGRADGSEGGGGDGGDGEGGSGSGDSSTGSPLSPEPRPIARGGYRFPGLDTKKIRPGASKLDGFWQGGGGQGGGGSGGGNGGGEGGGEGGGGGQPDPGVRDGHYALIFDLYLFDSWDGADRTYGTDRFQVAVNGQLLFDEVLTTFSPANNELDGWVTMGRDAYSTQYKDVMYPQLEILFTVEQAGELLAIDFIGGTNQPIHDESWGIDNVRVEYRGGGRTVPGAPTGVVMLGGLVIAARRRR